MNHDNLTMNLLLKYTEGIALSAEECLLLAEWQAKSPDNEAFLKSIDDEECLEERLEEMDHIPSEEMWSTLREKIDFGVGRETESVPLQTVTQRRIRIAGWVSAAAIVLLVVAGRHQILQYLAGGWGQHEASGSLLAITGRAGYRGTKGESPVDITLPDGSRVKLSYASKLQYPAHFNKQTRDVYLSGEAVFDVAENSDQPFIVHTTDAAVRVLGTYFNVSAYPEESNAVTVISGTVQVDNGKDKKVLEAAQQAVLTNGKWAVSHLKDPQSSLCWAGKDPEFNFSNTDLNTVLRQFARWYHVRVVNPDQVSGLPIVGNYSQNESLDKNLASVVIIEQGFARIEHRGDSIILGVPAKRMPIK